MWDTHVNFENTKTDSMTKLTTEWWNHSDVASVKQSVLLEYGQCLGL